MGEKACREGRNPAAQNSYTMNPFLRTTPGVRLFLVLVVCGWVGNAVLAGSISPAASLALSGAVGQGQLWRLLLYPFAAPISFNAVMSALLALSLGPAVEESLGTRRFSRLLLVSILLGGLLALLPMLWAGPVLLFGPVVPTLAIVSAYCLLHWNGQLMLMGAIQLETRVVFFLSLLSVVFLPHSWWVPAWSAAGLAYGMVRRNWLMQGQVFRRPPQEKRRRSRFQGEFSGPKVTPIRPNLPLRAPTAAELEVDRILEKLRVEGMSALTAQERETLDSQSNALRKRDERA